MDRVGDQSDTLDLGEQPKTPKDPKDSEFLDHWVGDELGQQEGKNDDEVEDVPPISKIRVPPIEQEPISDDLSQRLEREDHRRREGEVCLL